jgi:hypothetical protein
VRYGLFERDGTCMSENPFAVSNRIGDIMPMYLVGRSKLGHIYDCLRFGLGANLAPNRPERLSMTELAPDVSQKVDKGESEVSVAPTALTAPANESPCRGTCVRTRRN